MLILFSGAMGCLIFLVLFLVVSTEREIKVDRVRFLYRLVPYLLEADRSNNVRVENHALREPSL